MEIQIALLSCTLFLRAHAARTEGSLRYSAFIQDGCGRVQSHHFSTQTPFIRDKTLVIGNSEIQLHDGACLMIEDFLAKSFPFVNNPHKAGAYFAATERARA